MIAVSCASGSADTDPNIELINKHATAWYSGDYATSFEILGFDTATDQAAMEWSQYEGAIDARAALECASSDSDTSVYNCEVTYSNALYEAVGAEPIIREWSGRVESGHIEVLRFDSSPGPVESSWMRWATEAAPGENPCDPSRPPTPDCAQFQLQFLDEWAAWYEAEALRQL